MAGAIGRLLAEGQSDQILNVLNASRTVAVSELVQDQNLKCKVIFYPLKIKKGKGRPKIATKDGGGSKIMRLEEPYDRLLLARDATSGETFYLISRTVSETLNHYFKKNIIWTNQICAIYRPVYFVKINGLPVVSSKHSLIPLKALPNDLNTPTQLLSEDSLTGSSMKCVYASGVRIAVQDPDLVENCGALFCDAQHKVDEKCPSVTTGSPKVLVMECDVSVPDAGINNVSFRSRTFTSFFLTAEAMQIQNAKLIGLEQLEEGVDRVLEFYAAQAVAWEVVGWYKPSYQTETKSKPSKFHISSLKPSRVLADAPLIRPQHQAHEHADVDLADDGGLPGIVQVRAVPVVEAVPVAQPQQPAHEQADADLRDNAPNDRA